MKQGLLGLIVCPICKSTLTIDVLLSSETPGRDEDVVEGILTCSSCSQSYPIINGIPRMQPSALRGILFEYYPDFIKKNANKLNGWILPEKGLKGQDKWKEKTLRSFGYEWTTFNKMLSEYKRAYWEYFCGKTPEYFTGKLVLDAGCGTGRHAYFTSDYCKELIGIDLSMAVEVARKNTMHNSNVSIIQADIYNLPFRENTFDYIYSIGVLHHLPKPFEAFENLSRYVKPKGSFRTYLYKNMDDEPVHKKVMILFHHSIRAVTTKLPLTIVMKLSFLAGIIFTIAFVWPYKLLRKLNILKAIAEHIPFKVYADYPFRVIYNDQFDRFATPIENRYTQEQVLDWYKKISFKNITINKYYGWLTEGTKQD